MHCMHQVTAAGIETILTSEQGDMLIFTDGSYGVANDDLDNYADFISVEEPVCVSNITPSILTRIFSSAF